jgi:hypothetical protein
VIFAAAGLIVGLATAVPSATPKTTVFLNYGMPTHGYTSHYTSTTSTGTTITVDERVDAYNNREADVSLDSGKNSFKHHYMLMDGLLYVRGNDGSWNFDVGREAPVLATTLAIGGYWAPSLFGAASVSKQGTGPCGSATCDLYLASLTTTKSDKPEVQVSHIDVDQTSRLLVSDDIAMFDASGAKLNQMNAQFSGFDGQSLTIPNVPPNSMNSTSKQQCSNGTSDRGPIELCLIRSNLYAAMYALSINGGLVMRAGGTAASTGRNSPVMDGVFLKCAPTMNAQAVDPNLAATLKQSGMSDSQIQSQLGQTQTASDCTVTIADQTVLTAHFDFKS